MLTFDFETEGIDGNPIANPPKPVGVALKWDDKPSEYLAWGHPTGNNCSFEDGRRTLLDTLLVDGRCEEWLAHNAAFEAAINRGHFGNPTLKDPTRFHDTQYLVFLHDPYAFSFGLKQSAERILGTTPDEQDELKAWIVANVPGATKSNFGAHISKAPGELVGRYACGDVDRTYALFQHLYPKIEAQGMLEAYQREQLLAPILSESSRQGVRVDVERLAADVELYQAAKRDAEGRIFQVLGEFNIDSDQDLADRLESAGQVTDWVYTAPTKRHPSGQRSTSRKNLRVKDPSLMHLLAYRGVLTTCLGTFAEPWLAAGPRLHPQWNQVRGDRGGTSGARTGRMSCTEPNLQNIPNDFENLVVPEGLPPPMQMRAYLLPEEGHVWCKRDFSAQEMRILAHYSEGGLYNAFHADPTTDPHTATRQVIQRAVGIDLDRKKAKGLNFSKIYGQGKAATAATLGVSLEEVVKFVAAYDAAMPEVPKLSRDIKQRGRSGDFIRTWGGRVYYSEPHPERDLSYKLLNYLCQGSAADQTKQAIVDWYAAKPSGNTLIAAVHDEVNISVPADSVAEGMRILREQMDADRFDVPFRSEGFVGANWAGIQKWSDE
jgi:DNA polymerase I